MLELWTWVGIMSGISAIVGGIEGRKRICYHRWGKPAGGGSDMTWQGDIVCATQFAYTICISVMLQTRAEPKKRKDAAGTIVSDCEGGGEGEGERVDSQYL